MESNIAALFLAFSDQKLLQMTGQATECLSRLTDTEVWEKHGDHQNSIANLILHLCGNMRQWIMHGVRGDADIRERDLEFSATQGAGKAQLIELFRSTVEEARGVITATSPERLLERIQPQGRDVAVLEAIYQVVGHVQQHTGQIILLTKELTGRDLDLTMPRPR